MVYSAQTLQNAQNKRKWTDFIPGQLDFRPQSSLDFIKRSGDIIGQGTDAATAASQIQAQNRYNLQQLEEARHQNKLAQQNYVEPLPAPVANGSVANGPVKYNDELNPNAPMRTMEFNGMRYTVNSQVADTFQNFLQDLWAMGYHPKTIQGVSKRNIAGTNTPSLHSYGFAIDIDPNLNPVYRDRNHADDVYSLPPSVAALAAKYGLSWGGTWNSYRDYMHFSVPYGGRQ